MKLSFKSLPVLTGLGVSTLLMSQSHAAGVADIAATLTATDAIAGITAVAIVLATIAAVVLGAKYVLGFMNKKG